MMPTLACLTSFLLLRLVLLGLDASLPTAAASTPKSSVTHARQLLRTHHAATAASPLPAYISSLLAPNF
jgi:hypothetical protein